MATEGRRYAAIPAYADHFERMGAAPEATGIAATSAAELPAALARWEDALDDVVVRAITAHDTVDEALALVRAARPG